jgi:hypothetical protein
MTHKLSTPFLQTFSDKQLTTFPRYSQKSTKLEMSLSVYEISVDKMVLEMDGFDKEVVTKSNLLPVVTLSHLFSNEYCGSRQSVGITGSEALLQRFKPKFPIGMKSQRKLLQLDTPKVLP